MKPRSFLTLRKPTGANGNRGKNLKIQLLDTDSPEIRRTLEQCLTTLNTGYKSTWRTTSIKKIPINPTRKRKSEIRMAARRKQDRTEYLDLKRTGNEPQYIHEVPTPSSSTTVEIESPAVEGASSLESLQRLVTERKEYLEMSESRKQKLQWYQRVARQSDQLLNFLRADRSSGDSLVNADLVLVRPPAAKSTRDEPLAQLQPVNSTVISAQPETKPKLGKTTLKRRMQKSTIEDQNKPKHHKSDRPSQAGPSNLGKGQGKQNIRMAKPSGNDGVGQQERTPSSPAGRVMKKIQDARLALNTHISGSQQMRSDAASNKGKPLGNLLGDDKENQAMGSILSDDSMMCLRTTPGAVNNGLRKYGFYLNSDSRKFNHSNPNGVNNSGNLIKNGDIGLSPTRNAYGVPANRTWSTIKRKRVNVNGSWSNIMKSEAEGSSKVGAMGPMEDKFASMEEVRAHRPEDSIWWSIRKMWKKHEKGSEMKQEDLEESLSRKPSVEDDLPKQGGGFNPYKMLSRARIGRTVKRRRRDAKSPQVLAYEEDEADYPPGLMDFQGVGQPSGRCFVIPDQPYEVEEALSMDLMQTAFDFIHNG